jgi:hypothetical protein
MAKSKLSKINIIEAIEDPLLFGQFIKDQATFANWKIVLKAFFGIPLTPAEMDVFTLLTERTEAPTSRCDELWLDSGQAGRKELYYGSYRGFPGCFRRLFERSFCR